MLRPIWMAGTAYLVTQAVGVVLGTATLFFEGAGQNPPSDTSMVFTTGMAGLVLTAIPTLVYACFVTAIVLVARRRNWHSFTIWSASVGLTVLIFMLAVEVLLLHGLEWWMLMFLVCAIVSGLCGTLATDTLYRRKLTEEGGHNQASQRIAHPGGFGSGEFRRCRES